MSEATDEQVRALIVEHHGKQLAACKALASFAAGALQAWSGRPIKRGADRIIVAEAARATKTFDGVIGLCETGFGEQAVMLNRSLFEGMAVAHWVSDNRRAAVGLFTRHARFHALLWHETFTALGWLEDADIEPLGALGPKQRREFVDLFGRYGERPWVQRNLPGLLRAIEHLWDEEGRAHLWTHHDVAHRHSNQILHSTATAFAAATVGQTHAALHMAIGPSNRLVVQALLSAYWTYGQLFSLLVDVFKLSSREAFHAVYQSGFETFRQSQD